MWYEKLGIISIGAQSAGPDDGGLGEMKIDLWKSLLRHCKDSHCPGVSHYALALRIGGEFAEFGEEGVAAVRRSNPHQSLVRLWALGFGHWTLDHPFRALPRRSLAKADSLSSFRVPVRLNQT